MRARIPRWLVLLGAALGVAACVHRTERPSVEPVSAPVLDLGELADTIDPGPVEPLLSNLPPWLEAILASRPGNHDRPVRLDLLERFSTWLSSGPELAEGLESLLDMLALLRDTERRLQKEDAPLADLALAARIYHALNVPMLSDPQGFFTQLWRLMAQAAGQVGQEGAQAGEVIEMVRGLMNRAPSLHRRTAARILRRAPEGAEALQVLEQVARDARQRDDFEVSWRLFSARVSRLGDAATGEDWLDLAESCARGLRADCAENALRRAESHDMRRSARWSSAAALVALARDVVAEKEPISLEENLARAERLNRLGRRADAEQILGRMIQAHPRDARPWLGLAKVALGRLRIREAYTYIRQADGMDRRDGDYFAMALGTFWGVMMDEIMPIIAAEKDGQPGRIGARLAPYLAQVKEDLEGLARFSPERAAALQEAVRLIHEIFRQPDGATDLEERVRIARLMDQALGRVLDLTLRYPDEADVYRLWLLLARYTARPAAARQAAFAPIPPGVRDSAGVLLLQARVRLALLLRSKDPSGIRALRALVADIPPDEKNAFAISALRADLLAIEAGLPGGEGLWPRVVRDYQKLLASSPKEHERRLKSNLGVALLRTGEYRRARELWREASEGDEDVLVPRLLMAVTAPGPDHRKEDLSEIEGYSRIPAVNFQVRLWLAKEERLPPEELELRLANAWTILSQTMPGREEIDGWHGAVLNESYNVSMGYSESQGLVTVFELNSDPWLILPARR